LCYTLGEEAPQPEWGLPDGWGQYLSGVYKEEGLGEPIIRA